MYDRFSRNIEYVRISVTDRCNLRCRYCMPEQGARKMQKADILSFDEILRIVRALAQLGVRKVRLTGGEPLLRRGIPELVQGIKQTEGIEAVALTTNGVRLPEMADELKSAGLDHVNVSLDTMNEEIFSFLARRPLFSRVEEGLHALEEAGFTDTKINCVPLEGVNEGDLLRLAELAREKPVKVRFIELMPIGLACEAGLKGLPMDKVRNMLEEAFGFCFPVYQGGSLRGPAEYVRPEGFAGQLGFIEAMEHRFCDTCNRVRLTAEGFLKLCLHRSEGLDVRELLRSGTDDGHLKEALAVSIRQKPAGHSFGEHEKGQDTRHMYQVGG